MMKWASFTAFVLLYANWVSQDLASVHIEYILAVYNLLSMIYPFQGVLSFVFVIGILLSMSEHSFIIKKKKKNHNTYVRIQEAT